MSLRTRTGTRVGYVLQYPTDLAAVSLVTVLTYVVVTGLPTGSTARLLGAIPLTLFLPGYALVSALFPARARSARTNARTVTGRRPGGIDTVERIGLALPLSIVIAVLTVIGLGVTDWGLATEPVAATLAGFAILLAQIGAIRRFRVPAPDRYTVSPATAVGRLYRTPDGTINVSAIVLAVAITVAVGALLVGFLAPLSAGGFTQFAIYTEDEDGELVADGFPSEIEPGESIPVTIGLENHEGEPTNYTIVVQEQVIEDGDVVDRTELREIDARINGSDPVTAERSVTPTAEPDETVRISFLLYYDDPPSSPTNENAVEDVYFWVTPTENPIEDGDDESPNPEGDDSADAPDNESDDAMDDGDDPVNDSDDEPADNESVADNDSATPPDNETDDDAADNDTADDDDSFSLEDLFGGDDEDNDSAE